MGWGGGRACAARCSQRHLRLMISIPYSSYSCLLIHSCWNVPKEARILPPNHVENLLSTEVLGAMIRTFKEGEFEKGKRIGEWSSLDSRSTRPDYTSRERRHSSRRETHGHRENKTERGKDSEECCSSRCSRRRLRTAAMTTTWKPLCLPPRELSIPKRLGDRRRRKDWAVEERPYLIDGLAEVHAELYTHGKELYACDSNDVLFPISLGLWR